MAMIIALQNGRTKVVRNNPSYTGGRKRPHRDPTWRSRQDVLDGVQQVDMEQDLRELALGAFSRSSVDGSLVKRTARLCRATGEATRENGIEVIENGDVVIDLEYRDGKLVSASCAVSPMSPLAEFRQRPLERHFGNGKAGNGRRFGARLFGSKGTQR